MKSVKGFHLAIFVFLSMVWFFEMLMRLVSYILGQIAA